LEIDVAEPHPWIELVLHDHWCLPNVRTHAVGQDTCADQYAICSLEQVPQILPSGLVSLRVSAEAAGVGMEEVVVDVDN
jgi:hypothetical protein